MLGAAITGIDMCAVSAAVNRSTGRCEKAESFFEMGVISTGGIKANCVIGKRKYGKEWRYLTEKSQGSDRGSGSYS